MSLYSISDLEKYSGIKAHTIRIWEQRHGILKPKRTQGNTRYYNDNDLKKILNISNLIKSGKKISEISKLKDVEVNNLIDENVRTNGSSDVVADHFIGQMMMAGLKYDLVAFEKSFSAAFLKLGIRDTYVRVLYPLLKNVGLMWRKDNMSPAQEHFLSNLVRLKLFSVIDALPLPVETGDKWILFLPENEEHEIGLLYSYYILRSLNLNVIYLGSSVPLSSLKEAVSETKANHLLFFTVASNSLEDLQNSVNTLSREFKHQSIHIAGNAELLQKIRLRDNCMLVTSPDDIEGIYLHSKHV